MKRLYRNSEKFVIQSSEHTFKTVNIRGNPFSLSMTQLWLFGLRHCVSPHMERKSNKRATRWPMEPFIVHRFADLAMRFGFMSPKIRELRNPDNDVRTLEQFLRALCIQHFCQIDDRQLRVIAQKTKNMLNSAMCVSERPQATPELSTDDPSKAALRRYNSPSRDEYDRNRPYLFIESVYSSNHQTKRYPTSFAVTRDIFFSFFGFQPPEILSSLDVATPPVPAQAGDTGGQEIQQTQQSSSSPAYSMAGVAPQAYEEGQTQQSLTNSDYSMTDAPPQGREEGERSGLPEIAGTDEDDVAIDLEPHPSPPGGSESLIPIAPGFEDGSCIAHLETKVKISLPLNATQVVDTWLQNDNGDLIVLYWFQSKEYMKYLGWDASRLKATLDGLRRDHYFLTSRENKVTGLYDVDGPEYLAGIACTNTVRSLYGKAAGNGQSQADL